ncbi:MAG: hypothetical protein ACXU8U_05830 [Asticcacaulis sp.]
MNRSIIIAGLLAGMIPCGAFAQTAGGQDDSDRASLRLSDVDIVYQPEPASYRPENTDYDLADQGKRFDIECVIAANGHVRDCQAMQNNLADQNFVRVALDSVKGFIVGPVAHDGLPTAGRTLVITSEFHRTNDDVKRTTDIASAETLVARRDTAD